MSQFKYFLIAVVVCSLAVFGNGELTPPTTSEINLLNLGVSNAVQASSTNVLSSSPLPSSQSPVSTSYSGVSNAEQASSTNVLSSSPLPSSQSPVSSVETSSLSAEASSAAVSVSSLEPLNTTTSTSTTTPAPTPAPTPSPAPKPLPLPEPGMWAYTEKTTNVTCILVQFAAQLNVTYTKENSNTTDHFQLNVPKNASVVNGSCASDSQWIQLSWPASENSSNSMLLVFQVNETTKWYEMKSLNVSLVPEMFPNSSFKDAVELWHGVEWRSPLATSYRCAPPTFLNMTGEAANVVAKLTLSQLQEEAFRTSKDNSFSAARECGGGDLPDAVPIAVGCALGGLVVVVLVAYLIGRRRSAARGYLSM